MSPSTQGGKVRCELGSDSFPLFPPHQDAQLGRCQDTSCGLYHIVKEAGGWGNFLVEQKEQIRREGCGEDRVFLSHLRGR